MIDLFGAEVLPPATRKDRYGNTVAKRKPTKPNGYADAPGTGPVGETCGTCKHSVLYKMAGSFPKCLLMKEGWTHGTGSDIRMKAAACSKWETKYRPMTPEEFYAEAQQ